MASSSSSSLPSSSHNFPLLSPSFKHYTRQANVQVRAQSCRSDGAAGRSSNRVDGNLSVLRERIEQVKIKEKLERCCRCESGWNYAAGPDYYKLKRSGHREIISEFFELVSLVGSTIGFTCLTGTIFLCLVSIFVHHFNLS